MMKVLMVLVMVLSLSIPTAALEITAPEVPKAGQDTMPRDTGSFGDGLLELIQNGTKLIFPELEAAAHVCYGILITSMLVSVLSLLAEKIQGPISIAGTVIITTMVMQNTNVMIGCAANTVREICEYGKLLCPVLTTALAAQGGITASATLYTGTTAFISLLTMLLRKLIVPMIYLFLICSISYCALDEDIMKRSADAIKNFLNWLLKTVLVVFTTYLSITGVVSGTTDAAALKAAKITFSSMVPVVGGILSDASESVLVSMGILKNAAGIYGILAVLSVFTGPFIKVGTQYLMLKLSAALCSIGGNKNISALVDAFSSTMGLLLGMIASGCIFILISTICYLRGIGA